MYGTVIKMDLQQSERFELAAEVLSAPLRRMVLGLPKGKKERIQEIRLRENRPLILIEQGVPLFLDERGGATYICRGNSRCVSPAELTDTFNKICGYSVHSHMDSIINGYITIPGGHRAGICGTAVTQGGKIVNVRDVHAVNIRVAGSERRGGLGQPGIPNGADGYSRRRSALIRQDDHPARSGAPALLRGGGALL